MTTDVSSTFTNRINLYLTRGTTPTASTGRFLALATDGSYTEATGGGYARQSLPTAMSSSPTNGDSSNTAIIEVSLAEGTYTHYMVMDAVSSGAYVFRGPLTSSVVIPPGGGTARIPIGDFDFFVDGA
jgi:hypothetical protein